MVTGNTFSSAINLMPGETTTDLFRYLDKPILTPAQVIDSFKWHRRFADRDIAQPQFDFALKNLNIGLSGEELFNFIENQQKFTKSIHERLFPPGTPEPSYHGLDHVDCTTVVSTQMLTGGLLEMQKSGDLINIFSESPENIIKIFQLHIINAQLHELFDWWNLDMAGSTTEQITAKAELMSQIKTDVRNYLISLNLSPDDFNRLGLLDNFGEPSAESVSRAKEEKLLPLNQTEEKAFLEVTESDPPSIFKQLNEENRIKLLAINSEAIRGADFGQVLNPAYLQTVELSFGGAETIKMPMGPAALALEMYYWRNSFLKGYQWTTDNGHTINWEPVSIGKFFWDNYVCRDLPRGIELLKSFNEASGKNADIRFKKIGDLVNQNSIPKMVS